MKEVMAYFEMKISDFRKEWAAMSETDKAQIKEGIANGTLTY